MRLQKIEVLKLAKELLQRGEENFICHALRTAASRQEDLLEAAWMLKDYIEMELEGRDTLGSWLIGAMGEITSERTDHLARLAWIDKMIYDLEAT